MLSLVNDAIAYKLAPMGNQFLNNVCTLSLQANMNYPFRLITMI